MVRQSLFIVQFPTSAPVCQVEDFSQGTARSVDGALHIRPGGTKKITQTELAHLKKIKPWGRLIRVIKKVVPPLDTSAADTKAAKAKEQAAKAAKTGRGGGTKKAPKKVAGKEGKPTE
jgi:hypothetical protein